MRWHGELTPTLFSSPQSIIDRYTSIGDLSEGEANGCGGIRLWSVVLEYTYIYILPPHFYCSSGSKRSPNEAARVSAVGECFSGLTPLSYSRSLWPYPSPSFSSPCCHLVHGGRWTNCSLPVPITSFLFLHSFETLSTPLEQ